MDLHLNIRPQTAQRLQKVLDLHPDQESFAHSIIAYQITELKKAILQLRLDLEDYEHRYKQSSQDFYTQFSQGQTPDSEDEMLWAGLCELLQENEMQLAQLQ